MQLLKDLDSSGIIKLHFHCTILPHGISQIDVMDPAKFRRCEIIGIESAENTIPALVAWS